MIKKITLHIALVFTITLLAGKFTSYGQDQGIFFNDGATISTLKIDGLESFFSTYNDFHKNSISQGFDEKIGLFNGYSFMAGYKIGALEAGVGIVQNFGRNTAELINGDKQILKLNQQDYLVDMTIGNQIIAFDLGMMMSRSRIRVFYKNNNGVEYNKS